MERAGAERLMGLGVDWEMGSLSFFFTLKYVARGGSPLRRTHHETLYM